VVRSVESSVEGEHSGFEPSTVGLEQLAASGEQNSIALAHAQYFLALVNSAEKSGVNYTPEWRTRLEAERDNCRLAMRWALDADEPLLALRIAVALGPFWVVRSPNSASRDARSGENTLSQKRRFRALLERCSAA
jgi:hypothetical protein